MRPSSPQGLFDPRRRGRSWRATLRPLALALLALLTACRPTPKAVPPKVAPQPSKQASTPSKSGDDPPPLASPLQASPSQTLGLSLRLSTLPADTMALAQIQDRSGFASPLQQALDAPPASLARSLPLALRLPLSMLTLPGASAFPFSKRPMALVWTPEQAAIWLWDQHDLSLAARKELERSLSATTSFSPPYWIHHRDNDPLEYFVHTKARWLLACPRAIAPKVREWLKDTRADRPGSLAWAPGPADSSALLLRWRYPQILESAPKAPLGVTGELRFTPETGVLVNGAPRSTP